MDPVAARDSPAKLQSRGYARPELAGEQKSFSSAERGVSFKIYGYQRYLGVHKREPGTWRCGRKGIDVGSTGGRCGQSRKKGYMCGYEGQQADWGPERKWINVVYSRKE